MMRKIVALIIFIGIMSGCAGNEQLLSETPAASKVPTRVSTETPVPTEPFMEQDELEELSGIPTNTPTITPTLSPTASYFVRDGTPIPSSKETITRDNILQLAELAILGYGRINQVEYAYENRLMIVQTPVGIHAYITGTLDEQWKVNVAEGVSAMSVSSNQEWISYGTNKGVIHLVNAVDGIEIMQWLGHQQEILSMDFSSDDLRLVSGGMDNFTRVWDISSGHLIVEHKFARDPEDVFFTNNDSWIASRTSTSRSGDEYKFLDISTGRIEGKTIQANSVETFSRDNELYAREDRILTTSTSKAVSYLEKPEELPNGWTPLSADFSDDGSLIAFGLYETGVAIWKVDDGSFVGVYQLEKQTLYSAGKMAAPVFRSGGPGPDGTFFVDISSDRRLVAASNGYHELYIWEIESGELVKKIDGLGWNLQISPDSQSLAYYAADSFAIYNLPYGVRTADISAHWGEQDLFFTPRGSRLAMGSQIWNVNTGELAYVPFGEMILGFSPNGLQVFTVSREWWVRQWSTETLDFRRQARLEIPGKDDEWWADGLESLWYEMGGWKLSPDRTLIFGGAHEMPIMKWTVEDGNYIAAYGDWISWMDSYSPDGQYFVSFNGRSSKLEIYTVLEGHQELLHSIRYAGNWPKDVVVSPDSRSVAVYEDEVVYVYVLDTGEQILAQEISFDAEWFDAGSTAISPDNKLLVVTVENYIYLYDLDMGELISIIPAHFGTIFSSAFSPDGTLLATAAYDGTVRLWGIPND